MWPWLTLVVQVEEELRPDSGCGSRHGSHIVDCRNAVAQVDVHDLEILQRQIEAIIR